MAQRVERFINKMIIIVEMRNQKMTEVKTQKLNTAEAELKQTIAYIVERATNLSNYSTQLRSAVEKIAVAVSKYNPNMVIVGEIFYTNEKGADYMLHFDNDGLYAKKVLYGEMGEEYIKEFIPVAECSRNAIKAMVPEIPKFLKYASEQLLIEGNECKNLANAAEKMANILTAP
jgi:hypothetical protein